MSESTRIGPTLQNCEDCGAMNDGYGRWDHHHVGCGLRTYAHINEGCFLCKLLTEGFPEPEQPLPTLEEGRALAFQVQAAWMRHSEQGTLEGERANANLDAYLVCLHTAAARKR